MYTGPKLTRDALVFGFDTGYGIANNDTATRFYPGEPTTNLLLSTEAFDNTSHWARSRNSGSAPTVTANTSPNPLGGSYTSMADKLYIPDDGTYPRIAQNFTPAGTGTHTFSVWMRTLSGACGIFLGIFRNSPWSLPGSTNIADDQITTEWKRFSFTFSPADTSSHQIYIGAHDAAAHKGNTIELWGAQIEYKSHVTPYTSTARAQLGGLLDLKRTKDIDLSAMTYDSTGQPDFDGTNDIINLGNYDALKLRKCFSLEFVVRPEEDKWMYFFHKGYGVNNALAWGRHSSSDNWFFSTYINSAYQNSYMGTATLNEYCHLVATYDGSNLKLYENGVLQVTSAKTHQMMDTNTSAGIGGPDRYWNGKIPVAKVYSKVLTAEEVSSNFKAYKNRFNI